MKEPPFAVKETGYAGFTLPIDVYFKTTEEPKKLHLNYDLDLQPRGPPISKVLTQEFVFRNPGEDLRRRLIKGGGVSPLHFMYLFVYSCLKVNIIVHSSETVIEQYFNY